MASSKTRGCFVGNEATRRKITWIKSISIWTVLQSKHVEDFQLPPTHDHCFSWLQDDNQPRDPYSSPS